MTKQKRIRWAGHEACMGEIKNSYNTFITKPEQKRLVGNTLLKYVLKYDLKV
jgi:hypothetical protein